MAALVALLLHFVDEHFNDARYTRAATAMLAQIARSFDQAASVGGLHQTRDVTRWRKADMTTLSAKGLFLSV
jgi:hypothetical protein